MGRVAVFTFDTTGAATEARTALKDLEKRNLLALDDALVLIKDPAGHVRQRRDPSSAVIIGALVGGLMGFLLIFMFPVISVLFGAAAGALIGRLLIDHRVDKEFVVDATAALRPDSSALIILIRGADIAALGRALCRFSSQLLEATLSPDQQAQLCRVLEQPCLPSVEPARLASMPRGA